MTAAFADRLRADAPDDWPIGPGQMLVPGFLAHAKLGGGHRCEAWLSWSCRHLCFVTVKLARPTQADNPRARAALRREAAVLRALHHPAFPRLLDAGPDAPLPYIAEEFVEGPTLAGALDEDGAFDAEDVVSLGIQLAAALHFLHTVVRIVHLDVKPSNVVLRDGRPVLVDFGTARPVGAPAPDGRARGTAGYMAPEQRERRPAAPAMDVYALGVTLEELLYGARRRGAGWRRGSCSELYATLAGLRHRDAARRPASALAAAQLLDRLSRADDGHPVPHYAWRRPTQTAP